MLAVAIFLAALAAVIVVVLLTEADGSKSSSPAGMKAKNAKVKAAPLKVEKLNSALPTISQSWSKTSGYPSTSRLQAELRKQRVSTSVRKGGVSVRRLDRDAVEICQPSGAEVACTAVIQPSGRQAFVVANSLKEARKIIAKQLPKVRAYVPPKAPKKASKPAKTSTAPAKTTATAPSPSTIGNGK